MTVTHRKTGSLVGTVERVVVKGLRGLRGFVLPGVDGGREPAESDGECASPSARDPLLDRESADACMSATPASIESSAETLDESEEFLLRFRRGGSSTIVVVVSWRSLKVKRRVAGASVGGGLEDSPVARLGFSLTNESPRRRADAVSIGLG